MADDPAQPIEMETSTAAAPTVVRRQIKWGDSDAAGVVYTPRFLHFAVEAAEVWFKELTGLHWLHYSQPRGIELPPIAVSLNFHHALWPDDTLDLTVRVTRIGRSSHTVTVAGHNQEGAHCFDSEVTYVAIDPKARKSVAMPEDLKKLMQDYQTACDARANSGADT